MDNQPSVILTVSFGIKATDVDHKPFHSGRRVQCHAVIPYQYKYLHFIEIGFSL